MRAIRSLLLAVPLLLGSGCFVFDEIDSGMEIMEAHTPASKKKEKEQAAQTAEGEKPPTYQQALEGWWKDAKSLNTAPHQQAASDDPVVKCQHAGRTMFTKRSDCIARGGRAG